MIVRPLTRKAWTTIALAVRETLGIMPGDALGYMIAENAVTRHRVEAKPETSSCFATFSEWDSEADRIDYADL